MSQFPNLSQMDSLNQTQSSVLGYQQNPMGYQGTSTFPQGYPTYQPNSPFIPGYQPQQTFPGQLPIVEQSYIENILRLNLGKVATVYMNFENSQWGSKVFKGVIEAAGKDHIILSDPVTGTRYLLLSIYLNYITFDEEINYEYPFKIPQASQGMGTYSPMFNVPTTQAPSMITQTPPPIQSQQTTPYTQLRKKENKD